MRKSITSLLLISSLFYALNACQKQKVSSQQTEYEYSSSNYQEDWSEIKKMEEKGLGKAIIQRTDSILNRARKEKNAVQIFKAMAYRSKYINEIEEDAHLKILSAYEKQAAESESPLKELFHSATAELLDQYYQQNRWRFQNRTQTLAFDPTDIRTWSLEKIREEALKHYLLSLTNETVLQATPLEKLSKILVIQDKSSLWTQADLFSFLAHRALDYLERNEGKPEITSVDSFQKNFRPIKEFLAITYPWNASSSNYDLAFSIYQKLLSSQQAQNNKAYLTFYNLKRLKLAQNLPFPDQDEQHYVHALKAFKSEIESGKKAMNQIDFALASYYFDKGIRYPQSQDSSYRFYLYKAFKICETLEHQNDYIAKQAKALKSQITQGHFSFSLKQVELPHEPIELTINYRNHHKLFARLFKVPHTYEKTNLYQEAFINQLKMQKIEKEWEFRLTNFGDFQPHDSTIVLEGLARGNYFLMISPDPNFYTKENQVALSNFQISQLAYFSRSNANEGNLEIYLRHRKHGEAIPKAELQLFENKYDEQKGKSRWMKSQRIKSNSEGLFKVEQAENHSSFQFAFYFQGDTLSPEQNYYYHRRGKEKSSIRTHLFTDRSIYRPGQRLYFKGIVIEGESNKQSIKPHHDTEIKLFNANGEEVSKQEVQTNDFGSYEGSFTLPQGGLNGQYRLQAENGIHYLSVEDYKRPTFEIKLDSNEKSIKVNDTVEVHGSVQAYSGAFIGNAEMRYQVIRNPQAPLWPYLSSHYPPISKEIIANGKLKANAKGDFSFNFLAFANQEESKYFSQYHFEIKVWATSPSGEMQSSSRTIKVSQEALFFSTKLGIAATVEDVRKLSILAKNIEGKPINTKVSFQLIKLKAPKAIIPLQQSGYRPFHGGMPLTSPSFLAELPDDYEVMNAQVTTNCPTDLIRDLKTGAYALRIAGKDRFGKQVKFEQRFFLYSENSKLPLLPFFFWNKLSTEKAEVGESISILSATALKELHLLYEIESQGKIIHAEWITLGNEQRKFTFPVQEVHRGGLTFHFTAVHSNQLVHQSKFVQVPFSNKQLTINLQTFRDQLEPGDKEKWSVQLKDQSGKAVQAEVLAGMYDQSLDVFRPNDWNFSLYHQVYSQLRWESNSTYQKRHSNLYGKDPNPSVNAPRIINPQLNWFGFYLNPFNGYYREPLMMADQTASVSNENQVAKSSIENESAELADPPAIKQSNSPTAAIKPAARSDFRETAFFYPHLQTKKDGTIAFEFTLPEALTQWHFQLLAHDKELKTGTFQTAVRTQKELMIALNAPRFVREGDQLHLKATLNNLSAVVQNGYAQLEFFDPIGDYKLDLFVKESASQKFSIPSNGQVTQSWLIEIPEGLKAIKYRLRAIGEKHEDGEEKIIPVLPAKQLITESYPFYVEGNKQKNLNVKALVQSKQKSINPESFTVEVTANPIWQVVQALPYLQSGQANSSDQLFNQYYVNRLAKKIVDEQAQIEDIFRIWAELSPEEFNSQLEKNQALKTLLLEETPWLQEAKSESEQKRQIAELFNDNRLRSELHSSLTQLINWQLPNGAWPWFKGMPESRYTTQTILSGLGHLKRLGADAMNDELDNAIYKGLQYLDRDAISDYQKIIDNPNIDTTNWSIGAYAIQYLYLRSFYSEHEISDSSAYRFYYWKAKEKVHQHSLMLKAMLASVFDKNKDKPLAKEILFAIKDHAIISDDLGMYWKEDRTSWSWYNEKIERQALLIEAFENILNDQEAVMQMKVWLLKNKQANRWLSSKATAAACYAMLLKGDNWLMHNNVVQLKVGKEQLSTSDSEIAGSGYLKKQWSKTAISPEMGEIEVSNTGKSIAWGSAYFQYYQSVDEVKESSQSGIKVSKSLFKVVQSKQAEQLMPISKDTLAIGDRLKVRLRLESDRALSYVHLKDGRASGMEPLNELSSYKSQDGLHYYQSSSDASTHFFFQHLPRGVFILEYEVKTNVAGTFALDPAVFQSYYAPEFQAKSNGMKLKINQNIH